MSRAARVAFYGGCQTLGAFAAFYAFFMATTTPESWVRRNLYPH